MPRGGHRHPPGWYRVMDHARYVERICIKLCWLLPACKRLSVVGAPYPLSSGTP